MDTPRVFYAPHRRISVDWSLIAITAVALALLAAASIKSSTSLAPGAGAQAGGLPVLSAGETLVAFEDFNFGAPGWTSTAGRPEVAAVYGPLTVGTVGKDFVLPENTAQVRVSFNVRLTENAADDAFSVRVNGAPLVEGAAPLNANTARVIRSGTAGDYTVWILMDQPGDALSIEVEATPGPNAAWAIDNVSVVAMDRTS